MIKKWRETKRLTVKERERERTTKKERLKELQKHFK